MQPRVKVERHPNYRTIIVSGVYGGHRPGIFEAIVYTDEMEADEALASIPPDQAKLTVRRTLQCRLLLDPFQAKTLLQWLKHHVEAYEKQFGEIKTPRLKERRPPSFTPV